MNGIVQDTKTRSFNAPLVFMVIMFMFVVLLTGTAHIAHDVGYLCSGGFFVAGILGSWVIIRKMIQVLMVAGGPMTEMTVVFFHVAMVVLWLGFLYVILGMFPWRLF